MSAAEKSGRPSAPGEKDGRPPAPGAPAPAAHDLEADLERLAVPERSLFERADDAAPQALLGVHRANPLSIPAEAVKMAWGLIVLVAFGLAGDFFHGDVGALGALAAASVGIFAICLLLSYVVWRARTWELTEDGVRMRWGLGWGPFARHDLTIPYEHIHTVTMSSEVLERLFGLMALDLDTGAAAAEGDASKLRGLRAGEAEALRAELFRRKRANAPVGEKDGALAAGTTDAAADAASTGVPEERPLVTYELAGRQLILAAASRMSVASQAFALVILLVNGLNQLIEWGLLDLVGAGDELMATPVSALAPVAALFVAAVVVLGAAVSFVLNLVRCAGFRVERFADRVVVEHGLLSRSSRTVALGRVQYVTVSQGIIRRLMGYAEVSAQVVAAPGGGDGDAAGSVLMHPFLRVDEVEGFLSRALPAYAGVLDHAELGRLGSVALRRAVVRAVIWWPFAAGLAAGAVWLAGAAGVLEQAAWLARPLVVAAVVASAALLVALLANALLAWRHARFGHTARELVLVTGGLTRTMAIVPRGRLQRLQVAANPFQRRGGVANLSARTAASTADGLDLRDLPATAADELLTWFR